MINEDKLEELINKAVAWDLMHDWLSKEMPIIAGLMDHALKTVEEVNE